MGSGASLRGRSPRLASQGLGSGSRVGICWIRLLWVVGVCVWRGRRGSDSVVRKGGWGLNIIRRVERRSGGGSTRLRGR